MSKFQPIKFRDVDDLLSSLPKHELEITNILRNLIFQTLPNISERLAYNVPFFYGRSRICYIWPGSVPWGKTKEGVEFGFTKGYLLKDASGYLDKGNRKQVYMKTFYNPEDINIDLMKLLLFEADAIDKLK